jgi:hypothetical membrane protein
LLIRIRLTDGTVEVVDAGHPFPFLVRDGVVTAVELTVQLPLGLATAPYRADTVTLEPGDRLLMVTDGCVDRLDGRLDVEDFLRRSLDRHPRQIVQELGRRAVREITGGSLRDDATALCIDWYGPPEHAPRPVAPVELAPPPRTTEPRALDGSRTMHGHARGGSTATHARATRQAAAPAGPRRDLTDPPARGARAMPTTQIRRSLSTGWRCAKPASRREQTSAMRWWVWVSSAFAPLLLIGGWTLAQSRQPSDYDPTRDTISALAAHGASDAWIMTAGLAGLGASHLITAAGFWAPGRISRAVLAVGGAATVVVSASPQPAAAHVPAAVVGFVALAIWPAFAPRGSFRSGRWLTLALLTLLACFAITLVAGKLVGASERALAGAEALSPIALVVAWRQRTEAAGRFT